MRVIYMGTPRFAVPPLEHLAEASDIEVALAVTRPDAASARGKGLHPSPVKERAQELGIPVFECASLKTADAQQALADLSPDIIVVAAFGLLIPTAVLELPRHGCINIHPSLLPRWRGAAPIQRAILAGDEQTGVCIMRLEESLDTGPICACIRTSVGDKSTSQLTEELADKGAEALVEALKRIANDTVVWTAQDEAGLLSGDTAREGVTYASKIAKSEVRLAPDLHVEDSLRRIHASDDSAPARAAICGKGVRVLDGVAATASSVSQGSVSLSTGELLIGCCDGALRVTKVKPDGKTEMDAAQWLLGLRNAPLTWNEV